MLCSTPFSTTPGLLKVLDDILALAHQLELHFVNNDESTRALSHQLSSLFLLLTTFRNRIAASNIASPWCQAVQRLGAEGGALQRLHFALECLKEKRLENKQVSSSDGRLSALVQDNAIRSIEEVTVLVSSAQSDNLVELSRQLGSMEGRISPAVAQANQNASSINMFANASQFSINGGTFNAANSINYYSTKTQDDERREVANWLSPINFRDLQGTILHNRAPGTGTKLFKAEEYIQWRDGVTRTLWVWGIPGVGKTVAAASVMDDLDNFFRSDDVAVTCIFCDYKQRAEQAINALLSSLLRQLVEIRPILSETIFSMYMKYSSRGTRPRLDELKSMFKEEVRKFKRFFAVIDALDECTEENETRTDLYRILHSLPINILFTSRYSPSIERLLQGTPSYELHADAQELRTYVEGRLSHGNLLRHIECTPGLKEDIVNEVSSRASGMFLLARLHMDSLVLKQTAQRVQACLKEVSTRVDQTYENVLQRISDGPDEEERGLAFNILLWVTCAHGLLRLSELQDVLAVMMNSQADPHPSRPSEDAIVSLCAGLVVVDKDENHYVRLVHYTAQEFFDRRKQSLWPTAQSDMAAMCITYLSSHLHPTNKAEAEDKIQTTMSEFPFLSYAVREWGHHVRASGETKLIASVLQLIDNDSCRTALSTMTTYDPMRSPKSTSWSAEHFCAFFNLDFTFSCLLRRRNSLQIGRQLSRLASLLAVYRRIRRSRKQDSHNELNARDDYDRTPLSIAASRGSLDVAQVLLAQRASSSDIDSKDYHNRSPLSYAAESGTVDLARQLLERGADVTSSDIFGRTPLFYAVETRRKDIVLLLLQCRHIKPDVVDLMGRTPLSHAAQCGHNDMVELLIRRKDIGINMKDHRGRAPLYYCSMGGHAAIVKLCLTRNDINRNVATPEGRTALSCAAEQGHSEVVSLLLREADIKPNLCDKVGRTPLSYAAYNGRDLTVMKLLLARPGIDVETRDKYGFTALSYAAAREDEQEEIVRVLCTNGRADANSKDGFNQTPLLYAASRGHRRVVEFLLKVGGDVSLESPLRPEQQNKAPGYTANLAPDARHGMEDFQKFLESHLERRQSILSYAASYGWTAIVELILSRPHINADTKNSQGMTPLIHAAKEGNYEIAVLLLSRNDVDVNSTDVEGRGALSYASSGGHATVVQLLLSRTEIKVDVQDLNGRTPLSYAAETDNEAVSFALLKRPDLDINRTDNNQMTPLSYAASYGNTAMISLLLAHSGIKVNLKDSSGKSALCHAASEGKVQAVDLLLARRDVVADLTDNREQTPMFHAAQNGHANVVRQFLSRSDINIDINQRDYDSRTPLSFAAQYGYVDIVSELLSQPGICADAKDVYLRTPLSYAAQYGKVEVVKLLLSRSDVDPKSSDHAHNIWSYAAEMRYEDIEGKRAYREIMCALSAAGAI